MIEDFLEIMATIGVLAAFDFAILYWAPWIRFWVLT